MALNPQQFEGLARQLRTSGGFTVDTQTGRQPSSGVAVALPGREYAPGTNLSGSYIQGYARQHAGALRQPGVHLGGWAAGDPDPDATPYDPDTRGESRAQKLRGDVLDVSKVIPEHPRGHHMADVHHAMHVNRQEASFDLGNANTIVNPRYSDYTTSEREGGWSPSDEHGSSMRIMRSATPRPTL